MYANESLLFYFDEMYNVLQPNCFYVVLFCFYDLYVVLVRNTLPPLRCDN